MSTPSSQGDKRPLSPYMIGPYYRPQLTSVLSITHRATGVFLSAGVLVLIWGCVALAAGAADFAAFTECLGSAVGTLVVIGFTYSLWFHFFNGLRHLGWDMGRGLELSSAYSSGYAVLILALLAGSGTLWSIYLRN